MNDGCRLAQERGYTDFRDLLIADQTIERRALEAQIVSDGQTIAALRETLQAAVHALHHVTVERDRSHQANRGLRELFGEYESAPERTAA